MPKKMKDVFVRPRSAANCGGRSSRKGHVQGQRDGAPSMAIMGAPLWYLRDDLGLTGARFGCGAGLCGGRLQVARMNAAPLATHVHLIESDAPPTGRR
jgi:hypothetical protein